MIFFFLYNAVDAVCSTTTAIYGCCKYNKSLEQLYIICVGLVAGTANSAEGVYIFCYLRGFSSGNYSYPDVFKRFYSDSNNPLFMVLLS